MFYIKKLIIFLAWHEIFGAFWKEFYPHGPANPWWNLIVLRTWSLQHSLDSNNIFIRISSWAEEVDTKGGIAI